MAKKILFLSDSVSSKTGLGRITHDLALRVHDDLRDDFEVATLGYAGNGSVSIPFKEYHLHSVENWLVPELPAVWNDFVGEDEGILMAVWDMSRLFWLGVPQTCPIPHLRSWVESVKMKKWAYHAIDAEGPNGGVSGRISQIMNGFDRVLDYSRFSSLITGNPDHLPHGVDTSVFYPRNHAEARSQLASKGFMGLNPESMLIGIVSTNQARKNWQLGIQTAKILLDRGHDVRLWIHTDVLDRYWSIGSLIADYGLTGRVAITNQQFTDDQMAWMYSACNVTLGIGPEGFGYPIAESLACGVPCVCGTYGAQAEYAPRLMQVEPVAYFYEGCFCSKRPVHDPAQWAAIAERAVDRKKHDSISLPSHVDWNGPTLWPSWKQWFLEGLKK